MGALCVCVLVPSLCLYVKEWEVGREVKEKGRG